MTTYLETITITVTADGSDAIDTQVEQMWAPAVHAMQGAVSDAAKKRADELMGEVMQAAAAYYAFIRNPDDPIASIRVARNEGIR